MAAPPAGQLPPRVTGADMVRPEGRVSMSRFERVAGELLELPSEMISVLVWPAPRKLGMKTLLKVGDAMPCTIKVAVAAAALVSTGLPGVVMARKALAVMVLVADPSRVDVTLTVTLQPPAGMTVPTANVTVLPPPLAATAPPPQVVLALGGVAITKTVVESDSVSVKVDVMVNGTVFGLTRLMTKVLVPPIPAVTGKKDLATLGAIAAKMVSVAVAPTTFEEVAPPGVRMVVSEPDTIRLVTTPSVLEVTKTVMLQPPAGMIAPMAMVTVLPPASAPGVPVQLVAKLGAAATVKPTGNASVKVRVTVTGLVL